MIAVDMLPVNFVTGNDFRSLISHFESGYPMASRQTIQAVLEKKYLGIRLAVSEKLRS